MNSNGYIVHPAALVASTRIGRQTRVWAFCNILEGAVIGADCNICDHCFIENDVVLGDRVTVKNGVSLFDGITIEDDVFIGPHAVFTNDLYPRSKVYHQKPERTLIRTGATIGANATILAGHTIGRWALIGAGAVVTKDVPDFTKWFGNPGRLIGYVCKAGRALRFVDGPGGERCAQGLGGEAYILDDDTVRLVEG
ncbi:MAG: acyltransferase [bacterium]